MRRWSPVPFDLDADAERRLTAPRTRVYGQLAGERVRFDVEVHSAGADGLDLTAHGPGRVRRHLYERAHGFRGGARSPPRSPLRRATA